MLCGCLIALITYGLRTSFGLFATPITEGRGWSPEVFALAIAIQNLVWGIGQPFAGAIADRYGSARMLAAGGAVYALGVALMAMSPTPLAFNLTAGVLVGIGLSGGSFTIVIAALGRLVPEEKSSAAMGLATAAGSLGQFIFAPLGQAFLANYGWQTALLLLASFMVVVPALAAALRGRGRRRRGHPTDPPCPPGTLCGERSGTGVTCCWSPGSSCAAFTWPSSRRTCRRTSQTSRGIRTGDTRG